MSKHIALITLILTIIPFSHATEKVETGFIYGVIALSGCEKMGIADNYFIERKECDNLSVIKRTNTVYTIKGVNFGIEYQFKLDEAKECQEMTYRLLHPEMTLPSGEKRTKYKRSFPIGKCEGGEDYIWNVYSWSIDEDWENVKGKWTFSIDIDGKEVAEADIYTK
ncbi:MAG: DUF3859 domain-containing protein [Pseudomonadales bacterium]|nr:DUF3859 domain-containing protein [Pseudomonadales bacterium]